MSDLAFFLVAFMVLATTLSCWRNQHEKEPIRQKARPPNKSA